MAKFLSPDSRSDWNLPTTRKYLQHEHKINFHKDIAGKCNKQLLRNGKLHTELNVTFLTLQ